MRNVGRGVLNGVVLAAALVLSVAADANTSNKWRVQVSGGANADGEIVVSLLKVGGVIADVNVKVAKGTSENDIAKRIRDELKLALSAEQYKVEVDDGEDVLIKKRAKVEDFEVKIASNSVGGVRISVDRE